MLNVLRRGSKKSATKSKLVASIKDLEQWDREQESTPKKRPVTDAWKNRPTARGWVRKGGGHVPHIQPALEWRGTTVQVCGLWPFAAGSGLPTIGVPIGSRMTSAGGTVCCDPISWFLAGLANTPSAFVLGRPGLGKSTLVRRMLIGLEDQGVHALVLGDLKPDYVDLVRALGGQVIPISRSRGVINPLDLSGAFPDLSELPETARNMDGEIINIHAWVQAQLIGAQTNVMQALLTLGRGSALTGDEVALLAVALNELQPTYDSPVPTIRDVNDIIEKGGPKLLARSLARDSSEYEDVTRGLRSALLTLFADGPFGGTFDGHTTVHMKLDRPVVFDLSDLNGADQSMQAAVQITCWAYGSFTTALTTKLADLGCAPRRRYMLVMDELWRILRASSEMIDRIDQITRINRELGVGQIMATHTMADLKMETEKLTAQAWGFVERASLCFLAGLAEGEMGNLEQVFALSKPERALITDWAIEGNFDPTTGQGGVPPGRGKFLLKQGKKPGIPFIVRLTEAELHVHDTNKRWAELSSYYTRDAA